MKKIYVLHQRNAGTPEANDIQSIHSSWKTAFNAGLLFLRQYHCMNEEEALKDLGDPEEEGSYGNSSGAYIESYILNN